jgi:protein SCO1/2
MRQLVAAFALFMVCAAPCRAELSPNQLREVELRPSPGAALPLGAAFSAGSARVSLKDALDSRPAVLVLADFKCRYTCGTALAITADGLTHTGLEVGRDYNLLVIGINPGAGVADAEAMKAGYLAPYPRLRAAAEFLNGDAAAIASVTDALGYKAVYDAQRGEFAHPLGAVILTPEGRVSRVIQGLNLSAALLRPAILDARQSRLAAFVEGIRLLCYGHNPLEGAYTSTVQAVLKGGAMLTLIGIGAALLFLAKRKGARS